MIPQRTVLYSSAQIILHCNCVRRLFSAAIVCVDYCVRRLFSAAHYSELQFILCCAANKSLCTEEIILLRKLLFFTVQRRLKQEKLHKGNKCSAAASAGILEKPPDNYYDGLCCRGDLAPCGGIISRFQGPAGLLKPTMTGALRAQFIKEI